jgi:hypothetical protein
MQITNRRKFLFSLAVCLISATVVVGTVVADELLGVLTKVDIEGKKVTVKEKESGKDVIVTITDKTEQVSKRKGETTTTPVDLEKLEKYVKKVQENGQEGLAIKITHEKAVASKIEVQKKKKAAAKE